MHVMKFSHGARRLCCASAFNELLTTLNQQVSTSMVDRNVSVCGANSYGMHTNAQTIRKNGMIFKRHFNSKSETEAISAIAERLEAKFSQLSSFSKENQRYLGQPTAFTHPRLLKDGELMPGVSKDEFAARRQALFEAVLAAQGGVKNTGGNVAVLVCARETLFIAPDIPVPFRQDSDFLYLTGFREPGIENVLEHASFWRFVESLAASNRRQPLFLYSPPHDSLPARYSKDFANFVTSCKGHLNVMAEAPSHYIHKLRWRKSPAEVQLMRTSCRIGGDALAATMRWTTSGFEERTLGAKMALEASVRGAAALAYPCVVAGGMRANTIHYLNCDQVLRPHEMVLMDAGCDYHGYTSDITRSWPVSREFLEDEPHTELYEMLLDVQTTLLTIVNNERGKLSELYLAMLQLLGEGLKQVGAIDKTLGERDTRQLVNELCPHHVGHYLGMDVHDTSTVSRDIPLEPNVIITVEPGVYIGKTDTRVAKEFRGVGLRIEDDVLITDTGADVLSDSCPKTVHDINQLLD